MNKKLTKAFKDFGEFIIDEIIDEHNVSRKKAEELIFNCLNENFDLADSFYEYVEMLLEKEKEG
jgi:hypothetical protein